MNKLVYNSVLLELFVNEYACTVFLEVITKENGIFSYHSVLLTKFINEYSCVVLLKLIVPNYNGKLVHSTVLFEAFPKENSCLQLNIAKSVSK